MIKNIPEDRWKRFWLLQKELKQYKGKLFFSKALKQKVIVSGHSVSETAYHASKSIISTKLAIRLPYIIENAKLLYTKRPKDNKQTKTMKFQKVILLSCGIRGLGTALLTIGQRKPIVKNGKIEKAKMYEYCITDLRFSQKKERE